MPFFKDEFGSLHFLESEEFKYLLPIGSVEITDAEAAEMQKPSPAALVPAAVSRRQGRLALIDAGLLDQVEAYIGSLEDPRYRRIAQVEYDADTWGRRNSFLCQLWSALGKSESELDALFVLAAGL